jgi:hypothetical protein
MSPIWGASYARGLRLAKAGCSLPYIDALPGRERFYQVDLYVKQLGGYFESYAVDEGSSTVYALALRVGTDLSRGAIITRRDVIPPWPEHYIDWDYEPEDVLPKHLLEYYAGLVDSRLPSVLNERELLNRGRPVEGLLCGRAWAPIPASWSRERPAMAKIVLVDGSGVPVRAPIELTIFTVKRPKHQMRESAVSGDWETARKSG